MKKAKPAHLGTVIWAVDPLEEESRPAPTGARELARWVKRAGCSLLPVYVMAPSPRERAEGHLPSLEGGQEALNRYLRDFGLRGTEAPCVIPVDGGTRADAIRRLLQLAEEKDAAWIVVSSHGRKGLERLVLGSFAEELLRESERPVVFLSSRARPQRPGRRREHAIFATDFSERSLEAFDLFLGEAAGTGFDVILFHALVYPAPAMDGMLGLGASFPESYFAEQEAWAKAEGGKWIEIAAQRGVKASFVVRTGAVQAAVGRDILDLAAKEGASLIAMASLSGPLARFVVGSVPYEVFRAQSCPVWIYGPKALPAKLNRLPGHRTPRKAGERGPAPGASR